MMKFRWESREELSSTDLRREAREEIDSGHPVEMAVAWPRGQEGDYSSPIEALCIPRINRAGVAAGADADWHDASSLEDALELYFDMLPR